MLVCAMHLMLNGYLIVHFHFEFRDFLFLMISLISTCRVLVHIGDAPAQGAGGKFWQKERGTCMYFFILIVINQNQCNLYFQCPRIHMRIVRF